ncbi:MAG: hypothetical protein MH204_09680 [Fimbriimonadaceae bacterium]|nr:hypothetical protein [Fimbriimonadaceae bacterium]
MAGEAQRLNLVYSREARLRLTEIWTRNALDRGTAHADLYLGFLQDSLAELTKDPHRAMPVPRSPRHLFVRLRMPGTRGHFHLAVLETKGDTLRVIDFHHTAQDWERRYEADEDA